MTENLAKLKELQGLYTQRRRSPPRKNYLESLLQYNQAVEADAQAIRKKQSIPVPSIQAKPSIEELLNALIKPRDWTEDGKRFMQTVSCMPPSRDDINNLQKLLDERLVARQAREYGLCPIREELFTQCFNEIIRQVTIDCMERGIILGRVRDDLRQTVQSYQSLYLGSIPFGEQKQQIAEQGLLDLEKEIVGLNSEKTALELKKQELLNKKEAVERQIKENHQLNEQRRKADIEYLKYQGQHLEQFLKQVNPNKS